jgi:N-acetyl-gamma-glutamyl-phosphate reductase
MTARIFIDGEVGTTGLQIRARLTERDDIELVSLGEAERKDLGARAEALNSVDLAILCLPDDAAREAVSLIDNPDVRIIDASTAHRTAEGWTYGFPELTAAQPEAIRASRRVSNPGCYALTSVAMLHPLIAAGLLPAGHAVTLNAVSGYSGGGKGLIAAFEDTGSGDYTEVPYFAYSLNLEHKHLPEITRWSGLQRPPLFTPSVGRFAQGMIVQAPLQLWDLPAAPAPADIHAALDAHYGDCRFVTVAGLDESEALARLEPESLNGTNTLRLHVFANAGQDQALIAGVLDNLGKGASGQAVQNMNLMLGLDEGTGLD